MKYLIYLGHPAQYHFFKNIVKSLTEKGHQVKILIKSKDILETLLQEDGFEYENILPEWRKETKSSMFFSMLKRDVRVLKIARKYKPDVLMGSDTCVAHVGWLMRKPCIAVGEDDYPVIKKLLWLLLPFAKRMISPAICSLGPFENKKLAYEGYMKMAYLHPELFTPYKTGIEEIVATSPYCIFRLAKLSAHHDGQINGLTEEIVLRIIHTCKAKGLHVWIDAEVPLSDKLQAFQLKIDKNKMHSLMYYATMIISDSQSMSVEAAILGVPSIRFNDFVGKISVLEELEYSYKLTFGIHTSNEDLLFAKINELLNLEDLNTIFKQRQEEMLKDKINVTKFMVWFLDNYPTSLKQIDGKKVDKTLYNKLIQ